MRIYLGITGTGGQIQGSFEVGEIYSPSGMDGNHIFLNTLNTINDDHYNLKELKNNLVESGFNFQKYAIEIKDFREEDLNVYDFQAIADGEPPFRWLQRLPQSFQYVYDQHQKVSGREKAILMPIHQNWFDMIADGTKNYEFRNKLPKALRGAK